MRRAALPAALLIALAAAPAPLRAGGQVTYQGSLNAVSTLWRINSVPGAAPDNVSARLDAMAPLAGSHYGPITVSRDGGWYAFRSERFAADCQGYACITLAPSDFSSAAAVAVGGVSLHGEGLIAVASGGNTVVYEDSGGPHTRDLFLVQNSGGVWSTPLLLTAASPNGWNYWPVFSPDQSKIAFDMATDLDPYTSIAIGQVNTDGTGFQVLVTKDDIPPGFGTSTEAHSPTYEPDGSLVFESEWGGSEQIWRLPAGGGTAVQVSPAYTNDNSPSAFPDGDVASLWLGYTGCNDNGYHEIKVMDSAGGNVSVLTCNGTPAGFVEVDDIGMGTGPYFSQGASVASITPTSGPSAGGTAVAITGANFQAGASVAIGGVSATGISVPDATDIDATTPALSPGTLNDVVVVNPDSTSGVLPKGFFADFLDVDSGNPFHGFVEKLVRHSITSGCGGGDFCPSSPVLRSSMAVFLLRSEHGSVYLPPAAAGIFADVPASNPFAPWIEQLYNEGITGGCGTNPLIYCPGNPVSRAGMAVFLLVAQNGTAYTPPACAGIFSDVACPGPFTDWIEALYNQGITGGCATNPLQYCPGNSVTRASMAVFLVATFSLP